MKKFIHGLLFKGSKNSCLPGHFYCKACFFWLVLFISLLTGCSQNQGSTQVEKESEYNIYYLNNAGTKLVSESYSPSSSDTESLALELLTAMDKKPENLTYKKAKPDTVLVSELKTNEDGQLTLDFASAYSNMTGVSEILCRAAIVKTLCQIDGINAIEFYVNGQPLMSDNENPIGFMTAEDFIDDGEGNYNQNAVMTLFFANEKGNRLVESRVKVKYDGTIPMQQLIVEQLMEGPGTIGGVEAGTLFPTIPEGATLLNSSIKDGVCYVDFDENFLERLPGITDQVAIYSVVNSLVEMANVNKVEFSINGESKKTFTENTEFDVQFERNFEIVEDKE